jgi:hypothetical protein
MMPEVVHPTCRVATGGRRHRGSETVRLRAFMLKEFPIALRALDACLERD